VVDAKAYDAIAQNILAGSGFVEVAGMDVKFDKAIIRVGPLYQYFLAGIYFVFGHSYEAVWILQALLHSISVLFVYLSARIIFKQFENVEIVALLSAGIFAFSPDLIEISAMLMTETLYLFFWVWLIWYFLDFIDKNKINSNKAWLNSIMLGVVGGLAVLARPPVLFALPVIYFYFLLKKKYKLILLMTFAIGVIFTPWTIRNYLAYQKIMPFGGAGGYNFWIGNHVGATGEQDKPEEVEEFIVQYGAYLVSDKSIDEFKIFVREYPLDFVRLTALRVNRYFSAARPMGFWFYDSGISQFAFILSSSLYAFLLFVFSLFGGIRLWAKRNSLLNYFLAFIVLTPLILFVTVVETRYRFQIYPLVALLAGYGLFTFLSNKSLWKSKVFLFSFILVSFNAVLDLSLSLDKLKEKLGLFL
jgi:4-amino-4-deoxy-L-arabinose transferase-like glycosyltransferase